MNSAVTSTRPLFIIAIIEILVCAQACNPQSLDYLESVQAQDGAIGDIESTEESPADGAMQSGADIGAPASDSSSPDGPNIDSLVIDTRGEIGNSQGQDGVTPETVRLDGAARDLQGIDVLPIPDGSNSVKLDAAAGADAASGGSTGTLDAPSAQGGASGHISSGGVIANTGGVANTGGGGGTSPIEGGDGGTVATGGQADTGGTGGGGPTPVDGGDGAGGSTATGGQGATGTSGTGGSTSTTTCAGVPRAGICWYLGPDGSSCQQVCTSHGQTAPDAPSHVGTATQGGSQAECATLFGLLGLTGTPEKGTRSDGQGLGCHIYGATPWWLTSPNFSATASHASAKLVCGCTQ